MVNVVLEKLNRKGSSKTGARIFNMICISEMIINHCHDVESKRLCWILLRKALFSKRWIRPSNCV
jgi:hypothetical protein